MSLSYSNYSALGLQLLITLKPSGEQQPHGCAATVEAGNCHSVRIAVSELNPLVHIFHTIPA